MFYGAMVWDPWLIVAQIVCLQCLYYLGLGLFMALLVGTRVPRLTLLYLFDFATLTPRTTTGWCAIASFLLAAIAGYGNSTAHSHFRSSFPPARQPLVPPSYDLLLHVQHLAVRGSSVGIKTRNRSTGPLHLVVTASGYGCRC
ncbi:unnamed protein product [Triticum turgidum subsp. durum]|uniref:Uncharacterized protein n=1 Tax=Triticum turgidum subsp. durum TaxID=4567 RepID=A0A9R0VK41_TRITD|nr:unnamed protein product [Triticum turgidum subsp. durum]